MNFRDRRSVDGVSDLRPENHIASVDGSDDQPNSYHAGSRHSGHAVAVGSPLQSAHGTAAGSEHVNLSEMNQGNAASFLIDGAWLTDGLPTIRHVGSGRILDISSLRQPRLRARQPVDSQTQGLYLVSTSDTGRVAIDIVFVCDFFNDSHPYYNWLNNHAPGGNDYLPDEVKAHIPYARVWAYSYQANFDDNAPLSSAANNFLVFYDAQRQRDRGNNPGVHDTTVPKLVFVCVGMGGSIVKKVLLECLLNGSSTWKSVAGSCHGIIFLSTPHRSLPKNLASISRVQQLYPKTMMRSSNVPNLDAVLKELKNINRDFEGHFTEMPSTLCVVNHHENKFLPSGNDTLFPDGVRRPNRDGYLSVQSRHSWRTTLHKEHPIFIAMMECMLSWARMSRLATASTSIPPREEQVTDGVNLLSIDGGGVRGLASLLVIENIMREIARVEVALDSTTLHKARIPADYFDLAGGTSTGGLICIMLFRLGMDVQSAIVEYRRLSPQIFRPSVTRYLGSNIAKTAIGMAWFKGETLEKGVKGIVRDRLSWEEKESLGAEVADARLVPSIESISESSCKTFMCALKKDDNSAVRFRAYPGLDGSLTPFANCKIWEAARATSAAPFYFPSAVVEGVKFWDGGLANNNPVLEVLAERSQVYPQRPVNCVISLGTGFSERKPSKSTLAVLGKGKQILENVTNVNINDNRAREQLRTLGVPYFRFNPSTAEDEIGLADFRLLDALADHTRTYLSREEIGMQIRQCAELLYHRPTTTQTGRE